MIRICRVCLAVELFIRQDSARGVLELLGALVVADEGYVGAVAINRVGYEIGGVHVEFVRRCCCVIRILVAR